MGHWERDWYIGDDGRPDWAVTNGPERYLPGAPFGPGGQFSSPDPLHPGAWYADDPTSAQGGLVRFDSQGNVVGQYAHQGSVPTQGGWGWDVTQMDPSTGGPADVRYPEDPGGLFGLGPGWSSLVGAAMIAALGASAGLAAPALAGAEAGAAAAGTTGGLTAAELGEGAALGLGAGEAAGVSPALAGSAGALSLGDVVKAVQLANSVRNVAQNPSGQSVGSLLGSAASAYTGVPGLSTVGSFVGGAGQDVLQGGSGQDTLQATTGGSGTMADDGSGINWAQLLPQLLAVFPGLIGSGIDLAALPEILGRQEKLYGQGQDQYKEVLELVRQYQQLLNQYNQQRQTAYGARTEQEAQARGANQASQQARSQIGARLADPAQVMAGANAMYQPLSDQARDEVLRGVTGSLATRGITSGGAAAKTLEEALAPYIMQQQQRAMQNFLTSQQSALSGYGYDPGGPFTQDPSRPASPAQYPQIPTYIPGTTGGPQSDRTQAQAYGGASDVVAQLGKLLFGATPDARNTSGLLQMLGLLGGGKDDLRTLGDATGQGDISGSTTGGAPFVNDPGLMSDYQSQIDQLGSYGYGYDFGNVY